MPPVVKLFGSRVPWRTLLGEVWARAQTRGPGEAALVVHDQVS